MEKIFKIMIVEDSRLYQKYLTDLMIKNHYEYICAFNGLEAIGLLRENKPDLILLDVHLPGCSGYEVCEHVRNTPDTYHIPIIFITSNNNQDDIVKGFQLGGNDYVTKPFNETILESRITNQLDHVYNRKLLNRYIEELESINTKLKEEKEHSEYLASRDHLTGLYNRRFIQSTLKELLLDHQLDQTTISLALFDIDDFKLVNDQYGHPCGDYTLNEVVTLIQSKIRDYDYLSRWGGEEFLLVLPHTTKESALPIMQRILNAVSEHTFTYDTYSFNLTLTCGLSDFKPNEKYITILNRIDEALYVGKHSGKNRIIIK